MSLPDKQPQGFLILFVTSWKALVCVLTMVESSNWSCSAMILSSVNYSAESSNDLSISNVSISAKFEVLLYCFEPEMSDTESISNGGEVVHGELDSLSPDWVGNTDWQVKNRAIFQASLYIRANYVAIVSQ